MSNFGELWPVINVIGPMALGLVLAYGMWRNHTRDRSKDYVTEEATRELYENPPR